MKWDKWKNQLKTKWNWPNEIALVSFCFEAKKETNLNPPNASSTSSLTTAMIFDKCMWIINTKRSHCHHKKLKLTKKTYHPHKSNKLEEFSLILSNALEFF